MSTTKLYHLIGVTSLERGQLMDKRPERNASIALRQRDRFEEILRSRCLRPAPVDPLLEVDYGRLERIERIIGDHGYVYLHPDPEHFRLSPDEVNYGFVFAAEPLLAAGAILRDHDLLADYEDLFGEIAEQFAPGKDIEEWSEEDVARVLAAAETGSDDEYTGPNDAYYAFADALSKQDMTYPQVVEATTLLREKAAALQLQYQFTGAAALEMLRTATTEQLMGYEILVPKKVPLAQAMGWIVAGQEVPPRKRGAQPGNRMATKDNTALPPPLRLSGLTFSREETAILITRYRAARELRVLSEREVAHYFDDPANVAEVKRFYLQELQAYMQQHYFLASETEGALYEAGSNRF